MEQLLYKTVDFVESIGLANAIVLICVATLLFSCLVYLIIVLESYSSLGTIRDIISFGKYQVEIRSENGTTIEFKIVTAWNRAHAVEKIAKKLDTLNGLRFVADKL